ncbi:hypothetical protein INR49_023744 [Caranx melampygus]|nr:hypothetical protein INR49_023744 [Caranx melampygus]
MERRFVVTRKNSAAYLKWVLNHVLGQKDTIIMLKNPAGAVLKVAGLEHTMYREKPDEVNGWGKFYLPDEVKMEVLGVVGGTSCPCEQLVVMTCEDKKVYAYDGEVLHLVASGLKQLFDQGIKYPAFTNFYRGEAFKNMTQEDWEKVKKGPVGRKLEEDHQKLVLVLPKVQLT